ncbi:serine/threonine protein kinase [Dulcicalothrix desertica PCC 7102]|uniref:histidine kinase n=1 Tax=Dulcicalothrix desertica PCC 7102 TaxID=232991 RepID=A0A433VM99_9CYAN|nr:ATP-binding sensor histidine kinase [Dulcicalothrix desertica]RUT07234.1 serine/threonine protein kinase [Dulcicalothrix desertica PCC 7102]TWH61770.1 putative ATPase [Dulcicalothrix desertica PCC 7102]
MSIFDYQLQQIIYQGHYSTIYRAYRNQDNQPVIIKTFQHEYPTLSQINKYHHEYKISKLLNFDGVVKVYALEKQQNKLALILEDFGGVSLKAWIADKQLTNLEFLKIAISITNILLKIHNNKIIHKNINPSNIIFNSSNNQIKITDFGISTILSSEKNIVKNPNILEGTLAYISPEQTGRMNRSIDYRSDFYSLGITFYELLTGQLPFQSKDPMELVHCHIARQPIPPNQLNSNVPNLISNIVMKLLAKTVEDRYQSAFGLKSDLEKCLQLLESGEILDFPLAHRDISDKFHIPQKLYGREQDVSTLLNAFERMTQGQQEIIMISGYSGIGKSSLVEEIYKPITQQRGYFISGKFDQFKRNIPYSALVNAFLDLIGQILTESLERINQWREKILAALGNNGQLIVDVIPEIELIIGKQPEVVEVTPTESQNRFNIVFQSFINVFCQQEHPLVIFIDDLQWADSASLKLLELMMTDETTKYLFIIGAYRDNEVSSIHPLMVLLDTVQKQIGIINSITLKPLNLEHTTTLIAETFHCDSQLVAPLALLVMEKTLGNPFFIRQFLQALYGNDLLTFDLNQRNWNFDFNNIQQRDFTDNVVELLADKIQKLPPSTQNILKIAACCGKRFNAHTLFLVEKQPPSAIAKELWEAVKQNIILLVDNSSQVIQEWDDKKNGALNNTLNHKLSNKVIFTYEFSHDRVQQAAYSLISEQERNILHWSIGKTMKKKLSSQVFSDEIFDVVNQLNFAIELIVKPEERRELAQLNLEAGKRAKTCTAYEPALKYFAVGIELLPENSWQTVYQLSWELYINYAEALSVLGYLEKADTVFQKITKNIIHDKELALCYEKYSGILQSSGKSAPAFDEAIKGLVVLGIEILVGLEEILNEEKSFLQKWKQAETIEYFYNLKLAEGINILIGSLYDKAIISCYFSQPNKFNYIVSKSVEHILNFGITPQSGIAISWLATLLSIMECKELSFRYAELALNIVHQFPEVYYRGETKMLAHAQSLAWKNSFTDNEKALQEAYTLCHSTGNLQFASYCLICTYISKMVRSTHCLEVYESCKQWHDYCEKYVPLELGQAKIRLYYLAQLMDVIEQRIDVEGILEKYTTEQNYTDVSESLVEIIRIETILGNYSQAYENAQRAEPMLAAGAAGSLLINMTFRHFYAICCARLYSLETNLDLKQRYLTQLQDNLEKLKHWAEIAPSNFYSYYTLIEAEQAIALQDWEKANNYYLKTIEHARENGYVLLQAFATELLGELYWQQQHRFAKGIFEEAHYLYLQCGANKKAQIIEAKYSQFFKNTYNQNYISIGTTTSSKIELDLHTVIKASQALSSEIVLEELLKKLMQFLLENAGAERGYLILRQNNKWQIVTSGELEQINVTLENPIYLRDNTRNTPILPDTILNYVIRTSKSLVLNDAVSESNFNQDAYIHVVKPKSVLCFPLLNQGKLVGIIYLENNLTNGAFTSAHLEILPILSTQAAISIENATLYNTLELKVKERTNELSQALVQLQQTQTQLIQSEKMSAMGQIVAGVAHEINNPANFINGNITHLNNYAQDLLQVIQAYQEHYPHPSENIQELLEEFDINFITEDISKILQSMKTGTQRIREIILSLRNFSRHDEADFKYADINEGIENTLMLLKHRLQAVQGQEIQIIKEYNTLPKIECYPSQLNQVFLNLLTNAIDAVEESIQTDNKINPIICINTNVLEDKIQISIEDNGIGIPQEIYSKLFDPFFTTKPVGKGTGLGLSTSYQIVVNKHGGRLWCNSTLGEKTKFVLEIPIKTSTVGLKTVN